MNTKPIVLTIVFTVVLMLSNSQVFAQGSKNKSNGTLEILDIYVPDFIAFKPVKGVEFKNVDVYLIAGTKSYGAGKKTAKGLNITMAESGILETIHTEHSEVHVMIFDTPSTSNFVIEKIKFVVDDKEMFYNLIENKWETIPNK